MHRAHYGSQTFKKITGQYSVLLIKMNYHFVSTKYFFFLNNMLLNWLLLNWLLLNLIIKQVWKLMNTNLCKTQDNLLRAWNVIPLNIIPLSKKKRSEVVLCNNRYDKLLKRYISQINYHNN